MRNTFDHSTESLNGPPCCQELAHRSVSDVTGSRVRRFPAALASLRRRRGARERSGAAVAAAAAARSFGTLPWHVLEVLMSHVTGRQDVDAVRAARLVCRSWNAAVDASISTAIMRPMTRSCQDVDRQGRPIGVDVVNGSDGAAIRCALPRCAITRTLTPTPGATDDMHAPVEC